MAKDDIVQYQFTSEQSRTKAAENGKKGGIASGEAKRKKKTIREAVETMLTLELTDKEIKDLAGKGYDAQTQLDALAAAALIGAKRGNSQMFGNLMKLMGEGVEKVEFTVSDDSTKAMDAFFDNERKNTKPDSE